MRKPQLTNGSEAVFWSRIPEFSIQWNGGSTIIPYVEHYLNNIINDVKKKVGDRNPKLQNELDFFIRQEAGHARYHLNITRG